LEIEGDSIISDGDRSEEVCFAEMQLVSVVAVVSRVVEGRLVVSRQEHDEQQKRQVGCCRKIQNISGSDVLEVSRRTADR
jgi:hypothetical protein